MDKVESFVKKGIYIGIAVFVLIWLVTLPENMHDLFGNIGNTVAATMLILCFYEKQIWRYNPLEKTPRLKQKYSGKIKYRWDEKNAEKNIEVWITQSLLKVRVKIKTDEIMSNSISSELLQENGQHVLYYTYITTPKSEYSDSNPIQYGTSRLVLCEDGKFEGIYWTSRKTKGDLYLNYYI